MKDLVKNVIRDSKALNDITLYEFVTCQYSSNTSKYEQWFIQDFVQNLIHYKNVPLTLFC